jgi:hypothetical protein
VIQTSLPEFSPSADGDVGAWELATDEPGFLPWRRYWRTDERVLVAHREAGFFAVYDTETWSTGVLGRDNEPVVKRRDLDDAFDAAVEYMAENGGDSR